MKWRICSEMNHGAAFLAAGARTGGRRQTAAGLAAPARRRAAPLRARARSASGPVNSLSSSCCKLSVSVAAAASLQPRRRRLAGQRPRRQSVFGVFHEALEDCAGSPPPVACFIGALSSLPTHTPHTRSAVKPTNQASRKSWVVPVLPALGRSSSRAALPVPRGHHFRHQPRHRREIVGRRSRCPGRNSCAATGPFPSLVRIRTIPKAITPFPPLAKGA